MIVEIESKNFNSLKQKQQQEKDNQKDFIKLDPPEVIIYSKS